MKFGKRLKRQAYKPWLTHYIDYKRLKHKISLLRKDEKPTEEQIHSWHEKLQLELKTVNIFFSQKESEFHSQFQQLEKVDRESLEEYCKLLAILRYFVVLNYMAVFKIVKKWNKKTKGVATPIDFKTLILGQEFYTSESLAKLTVRADLLLSKKLPHSQIVQKWADFQCPICLEVLCNPVVLSCSHSFCWGCLCSSSKWSQCCPVCRKIHILEPKNFTIDWILRDFLQEHFPLSQDSLPKDTLTIKKPKVVIIGIDGCRPDCLQTANAPNIKKKGSAFSFKAQTCEITLSGPAWSSVFTGVWETKHSVMKNDNLNLHPEYPHLFYLMKQNKPDSVTASILTWKSLVDSCDSHSNHCSTHIVDAETTKATLQLLHEDQCPDAIFVHLDTVDHAGHDHGFDPNVPEYIQAIEEVDVHVGEIMDQIHQRSAIFPEDWLVILVTDHGGSKLKEKEGGYWGHHGHNIPEHRTIFIIMHGKQVVPGELVPPPHIVDVPATALAHVFGRLPDPKWRMDGVARGLKMLKSNESSKETTPS